MTQRKRKCRLLYGYAYESTPNFLNKKNRFYDAYRQDKKVYRRFRAPLRLPSARLSILGAEAGAVRLSSENYRPQETLRETARCRRMTGRDEASARARAGRDFRARAGGGACCSRRLFIQTETAGALFRDRAAGPEKVLQSRGPRHSTRNRNSATPPG